jgi:putative toxin-antitoxin system antitoxin component (TIGR02293 family)
MKAMGRASVLVRAQAKGNLTAGEAAARVKAGLPVAEFDALRTLLDVTVDDLAARVGISIATLSRRRHNRQPLDPSHGDRVWRLAHLFRLATELYDGDQAAARAWITKPSRAFDGEAPLDHAATEAGGREVESLIGRLEHAVYT